MSIIIVDYFFFLAAAVFYSCSMSGVDRKKERERERGKERKIWVPEA